MTKKKRLFEMKKELKTIKKLLDKSNKWLGDIKWGNATYYEFITRDKKLYVIGATTYDFPKINFKDIIYIRKCVKPTFNYYDTDIGYYNISFNYSYFEEVNAKYGVTDTISTGISY